MQRTYNTSHVRKINQRAVLDSIMHYGSISKAELARQMGLSKPAMADNVQSLLELGLVCEGGEGNSGPVGGRKPIMLSLNAEYKYIVTIDFFYTFSSFMLVNLKGEVVEKFSINQTPAQSFEAWMEMSVNAVNTLLFSQAVRNEDVAAIGVSAPGVVGGRENIASAMSGEFDTAIFVKRLQNVFGCEVYTKNSANVYAVAEAVYGAGIGYDDVLYISCGEGIGAGILLEGRLYEGSGMAAGEIGNFVTRQSMNEPTRLEERLCIDEFLNHIRKNAPDKTLKKLNLNNNNRELFQQVVDVWKKGDDFLIKSVEELAYEIGCVVADMSMLLNCDVVIIGGEYIVFGEQTVPIIQKIVTERCYLPAKVVLAQLGREGRGLGMMTLCREFYFDKVCGLAE